MTLFSVEEFLTASRGAFELPENARQKREKPRASGIVNCARQVAWYMADVEATDESHPDTTLTTEGGRMYEDISIKVLEQMGIEVVDRQVSLPDDYPVTGHPDGKLIQLVPESILDRRNPGGLVWGFEHKFLGRWGYEHLFQQGLEASKPEYICQTALYGDALGWDKALFVIVSQDASSTRSDARNNLKAKNPARRWAHDPDWNPKVQLHEVDIRPLKSTLIPGLHARANWLSAVVEEHDEEAGEATAREYDPTVTKEKAYAVDGEILWHEEPEFPCSYCPFLQRCLEVGQQGDFAPTLPFMEAV